MTKKSLSFLPFELTNNSAMFLSINTTIYCYCTMLQFADVKPHQIKNNSCRLLVILCQCGCFSRFCLCFICRLILYLTNNSDEAIMVNNVIQNNKSEDKNNGDRDNPENDELPPTKRLDINSIANNRSNTAQSVVSLYRKSSILESVEIICDNDPPLPPLPIQTFNSMDSMSPSLPPPSIPMFTNTDSTLTAMGSISPIEEIQETMPNPMNLSITPQNSNQFPSIPR